MLIAELSFSGLPIRYWWWWRFSKLFETRFLVSTCDMWMVPWPRIWNSQFVVYRIQWGSTFWIIEFLFGCGLPLSKWHYEDCLICGECRKKNGWLHQFVILWSINKINLNKRMQYVTAKYFINERWWLCIKEAHFFKCISLVSMSNI